MEQAEATGVGTDLVLRTIDFPLLIVDDEGTVVEYDEQMGELIDVPREDALGTDELGRLVYGESGKLTMAEKVARAPQTAAEDYGLDRATAEYALLRGLDGPVYEDKSTTASGQDLWFIATPLYRGDDFVGVLELVQDEAHSERRQVELEALLDEIRDTLGAFERGEFGRRVQFDRTDSILDDDLLALVEYVNDVGAAIERMTGDFEQGLEELSTSLSRARELAAEIEDNAATQQTEFEDVQTELQEFSARMEAVASNSREVAASIDDARDAAGSGREAIDSATDTTATVRDTTEDLVATVEELGERMADVEEVADIIADVADQTNILALNANIEAARADDDSNGFGVVANEVKNLATETQEHTDRIADQIGTLQSQVDETVSMVRETHEHVQRSNSQVSDAATAIDTIVDEVNSAARGVDEIAQRNDEQAAAVERVMETVDEAVETARANRDRSEDIARVLR